MWLRYVSCGWLLLAIVSQATAAEPKTLWQIGKPDGKTAELAHGPNGFHGIHEDALFVVGLSNAKKDWPYAQPGPEDAWAESRSHLYTVLFGINKKPDGGEGRLTIALAATHGSKPPEIVVSLNGQSLMTKQLPAGGDDACIHGNLANAKPTRLEIPVSMNWLRAGVNELTIETRAGSWLLYDSLMFEAPAGVEGGAVQQATVVSNMTCPPVLVERDGKLRQAVQVPVLHVGQPAKLSVNVAGEVTEVEVKPGRQQLLVPTARVDKESTLACEVKLGDTTLAKREVTARPVRPWTVYLLPHSHVDIGFTHHQSEVEKIQMDYLDQVIELSRKTADYPPAARFKWNSEVLWAVESYLNAADDAKKQAFWAAVKRGDIGLDGMYCNQLTGLCRDEELLRLFDYARRLQREQGVTIEAAMISDVPGWTWGTVPAMAQSGIKYFSCGTNRSDRIGYVLEAWGDKPFWWVSPSGKEKVLCFVHGEGYSWFHGGSRIGDGKKVFEYLSRLEKSEYPYDILPIRYNIGGDNGPPDPELPDLVRDWNARYAYPKLIIATTSEAFHDFEKKYGDKLPSFAGDITPYWEDGAASSAKETAMNRRIAEQLVQNETLWAMLRPTEYPADAFWKAWRNVILYDEHTWGAHCSISQPDSEFTEKQWATKQQFAMDGLKEAAALREQVVPLRFLEKMLDDEFARVAAEGQPVAPARETVFLVYNTNSWTRSDRVKFPFMLPHENLYDDRNALVPLERLDSVADKPASVAAFVASDVPAFGARAYRVKPRATAEEPAVTGKVWGKERALGNGLLEAEVNARTGALETLKLQGLDVNFVCTPSKRGVAEYLYVAGKEPAKAEGATNVVRISSRAGALHAHAGVAFSAPGCRAAASFFYTYDGFDHLRVSLGANKLPIRTKEGAHLAFPLNVPNGIMRVDAPWAVVQPEKDQLPGSCKNWLCVQRWVDVSNDEFGVTCVILDAPLIEVGAITAETPWKKHLEPSSHFYSYLMNNYWHTNYRAEQEGLIWFNYALRPHRGGFSAIDAAKFAIEQSQPLFVAVAESEKAQSIPSRLIVDGSGVIATLKPSDDRKAIMVRLFAAGGKDTQATLKWADPQPKKVFLSNLFEKPVAETAGPIAVPAWGIVTVRAEL